MALIPVLLCGMLFIVFWRGLSLKPQELPSVQVGKVLPNFRVPTLNGQTFSDQTLRGKVSIINVWASWCDACSQEQVFLFQLAQQEGIPIYGLNYKDDASHARAWLHEWGNPYTLVAEDNSGHLGINLGVYGVPETFLIDEHGVILHRHAGLLTATIWEKEFKPLLTIRRKT